MNTLQELDRSWVSQDPSINRLKLTDEFRVSRPVGGRPYSQFAGELATHFADINGATVYGDPNSMQVLAEGKTETGELQLFTSLPLVQSADLKKLYENVDLRRALLRVADGVGSISRRISNVSYGSPEIAEFQPCLDMPIGSLIASHVEAPTLRRLNGEQSEIAQALGVRSRDSQLLYGCLVIPWLFLPNGTPEETVAEAHQYISRQELPQVVLDAAGYIAMSTVVR